MKQILLSTSCLIVLCAPTYAQKAETFDGVTYTAPVGWKKMVGKSALQLSTSGAKGGCVITLFKAVPGSSDARKNFSASWDTLVKETVKPSSKPEMQPNANANGWIIESGVAPFGSEGKKGAAMLITATGNARIINLLVVMDSDAYQKELTAFVDSLGLPKITSTTTQSVKPQPLKPVPSSSGKYQFTTTNFDDGWTATEQADWVRVTKGTIAVLVHYPNQKADAYNSVLKDGLQTAWNILVAPRYTNIRNFALKPIQSFESIAFTDAEATDKATGKNVYIVLFKKHFTKGNGKYIEFIANTKADFEREFGAYHNDEFGWDKLVNMQAKNRFAVAASDLAGKWSTSDYASLSYYYVSSGRFAGATATSTADSFTFAQTGTYQSDHSGASGMVGNQKFSRQVYKGNYSTDRWTITLTNRFQGESEKFDCYFEAIKGGRILMLTNPQKTTFSLVK